MSLFTRFVRKALARFGFSLSRTVSGTPGELSEFLNAWAVSNRDAHVFLCDSAPEVVRALYMAFLPDHITLSDFETVAELLQERLGVTALVVASYAELSRKEKNYYASLQVASHVLVRVHLGQCVMGNQDISKLVGRMTSIGYHVQDVAQIGLATSERSASQSVFLIISRQNEQAIQTGRSRSERMTALGELLSNWVQPIILSAPAHIAGRGICGFAAGVYNPGAIEDEEGVVLVARGEKMAWGLQKSSQASFESSCAPVVITLDGEINVNRMFAAHFVSGGGQDAMVLRREDFRLFRHRGVVYSNHTQIHAQEGGLRVPLQPEHFRVSVGIAAVDLVEGVMKPLGTPHLGIPLARMEKNWAVFSDGNHVHCLYSFNPYRLFTALRFPELDFTVAIERPLQLPVLDDALPFRNSINPIPYNSECFLHIVHKVYPAKRYVFWAVLLERKTLLPVFFSARPLVRAGVGSDSTIVYVSAALCRNEEVILFAGIDDCNVGAWTVSKRELDSHWLPIT